VVLVVGEFIGRPQHRAHRTNWVRLWRPFMATGVLGGFTTFSTFVLELNRIDAALALIYLITSVALGLSAFAFGNAAARRAFGARP
jgi:CrcB protein